uniref:Selenide, water dikinase n=1 Tax=Compsopogon caeruleus TaxID=31354 RepID=A0A7S1TI12_9RHOD|mmetsp:Transcript_8010/g.16106  ORF Transcript_8010/g.16106 Transcript_8010/m.16106 type:complete len:314 (+) Transcript_8010:255-1196(+)
MDCSVRPLEVGRGAGLSIALVSTIDFFFPLVEDPVLMGRIGCANTLSDLYAMGVSRCDNMLMVLAASRDMPPGVQEIVTRAMVRGFKDAASEGGVTVTGGQSILNPWPIIGGVAQSVVSMDELVFPNGAQVRDLIVLTKPLGTQIAVNLHQWLHDEEKWERVEHCISKEQARRAYDVAAASMERLNRCASTLMKIHGAHCATDVTGFGILGHAENLASNQRNEVSFILDLLPIIRGMSAVDSTLSNGDLFKLKQGRSAETSGGLLICFPEHQAQAFCDELERLESWQAYIVGRVEQGNRSSHITTNVKIVEVE